MTVRLMMLLVVAWGAATLAVLVLGFDTLGGVMTLAHLGGLIGAPLALVLSRQVRSIPVVLVLSIALSMALSALAVQSLIWFSAATDVLLVVIATAYGCSVAALLESLGDQGLEPR